MLLSTIVPLSLYKYGQMSFEPCTSCASCSCSPLLTWNVATKVSSSSCAGKVFTYATIKEWIFVCGTWALMSWTKDSEGGKGQFLYGWELLPQPRYLACSSRFKAAACCTGSASFQMHTVHLTDGLSLLSYLDFGLELQAGYLRREGLWAGVIE